MAVIANKVKRLLDMGKSLEQKIKELDIEGSQIINESFMRDLTEFQNELIKLEDDALKIGAEELFASTRALRDMNAALIATYSKMQQYTSIIQRQMWLELRWLKAFEQFEFVANKFYEFVKKFKNTRILRDEIAKRVKLATKKVAVAMLILFKHHVDLGENWVPIDAEIKKANPSLTKKYHEEFVQRRKKLLEKTE